MKEAEVFRKLRGLLREGWIEIPNVPGYKGTGAPGRILEDRLGIKVNNRDHPDADGWEVKYCSGKALLTLFHKDPEPKGIMHQMVRQFGWKNKAGHTCFRHTIAGKSDRGFEIVDDGDRIIVRNSKVGGVGVPYWTHATLVNAMVYKLRRLIVVNGEKGNGRVRFSSAVLYDSIQTDCIAAALENGIIRIDFDARTMNGRGLRNHGTKFRIRQDDLKNIYTTSKKFT